MKKILLLLTLLLFSVSKSFACMNEYYALDKDGKLLPFGNSWKYPFHKNFNPKMNAVKLQKLEQRLKKEKNYMFLSDYSVSLMKLGKHKEALEILVELYKHYPNEYRIVANLGTAYELNGQEDSALKYIKRDLELNPNDHEGSEWIHVKILETKIALKTNPTYLSKYTVLQLSEAQKNDSVVLQHLSIQLQERVPFTFSTPKPDEIMASLFVDLGDLSANIKSIEYAKAYYEIAKHYYESKLLLLDERIKRMQKLLKKYSAIKPQTDENMMGSSFRIGSLKYQELLKNNIDSTYQINWEKINTNVASLLAYVDFSKTVQEAQDLENKNSGNQTGALSEQNESTNSNKEIDSIGTENKAEKNQVWIFILAALAIILIGYLLSKKKYK